MVVVVVVVGGGGGGSQTSGMRSQLISGLSWRARYCRTWFL